MDALITNLNGTEHKLSDFGFQVLNFEESAPTITRTTKSFDGRAGSLDYGGRHVVKRITINGLYWVKSLEQVDDVRDKVNAALSQTESIYLTRIYGGRNLYDV
ncbi:phage tail protein, partial [Bacteroides fragilis]